MLDRAIDAPLDTTPAVRSDADRAKERAAAQRRFALLSVLFLAGPALLVGGVAYGMIASGAVYSVWIWALGLGLFALAGLVAGPAALLARDPDDRVFPRD